MVAPRLAFLDKYSLATKTAGFGGTGILILAIALHILSLSTSYYFTLSDSAVKDVMQKLPPEQENFTFGIHYGLWAVCVHAGNATSEDQCYQIQSNVTASKIVVEPDWLVAPRVLAIVGLLVAAAGVVSVIAFAMTSLDRMPQLFLATAAVAAIIGGILILSGDIAFAAEKTIAFYAVNPMEQYFFPSETLGSTGIEKMALKIQQYDNRFVSGWSFIIDLISGSLSIVAGPCFVFVAWRLQLARDVRNKQPADPSIQIYQGRSGQTKL